MLVSWLYNTIYPAQGHLKSDSTISLTPQLHLYCSGFKPIYDARVEDILVFLLLLDLDLLLHSPLYGCSSSTSLVCFLHYLLFWTGDSIKSWNNKTMKRVGWSSSFFLWFDFHFPVFPRLRVENALRDDLISSLPIVTTCTRLRRARNTISRLLELEVNRQ